MRSTPAQHPPRKLSGYPPLGQPARWAFAGGSATGKPCSDPTGCTFQRRHRNAPLAGALTPARHSLSLSRSSGLRPGFGLQPCGFSRATTIASPKPHRPTAELCDSRLTGIRPVTLDHQSGSPKPPFLELRSRAAVRSSELVMPFAPGHDSLHLNHPVEARGARHRQVQGGLRCRGYQ